LALDGGGYKGLYTAAVLEKLEERWGRLIDHFDLVAGTSVGGLIVLALAAGKTTAEIRQFFLDYGDRIFPHGNVASRSFRRARQLIWGSKYRAQPLDGALTAILGEARVGDSRAYLCIPTLDLVSRHPFVFKTDHAAGLNRDSRRLMREVARATAAAPTYFPAAVFDDIAGKQFVDGGLWANNPTLVAYTEALHYFVGPDRPYAAIDILSIGTATEDPGRTPADSTHLSAMRNGVEIITSTLAAQQRATNFIFGFFAKAAAAPLRYVRIPEPTLSASQAKCIGLDVCSDTARAILLSVGTTVGDTWKNYPEIALFFAAPKRPPIFY
jgi:predicted acylesterase/phospholipase RssA